MMLFVVWCTRPKNLSSAMFTESPFNSRVPIWLLFVCNPFHAFGDLIYTGTLALTKYHHNTSYTLILVNHYKAPFSISFSFLWHFYFLFFGIISLIPINPKPPMPVRSLCAPDRLSPNMKETTPGHNPTLHRDTAWVQGIEVSDWYCNFCWVHWFGGLELWG